MTGTGFDYWNVELVGSTPASPDTTTAGIKFPGAKLAFHAQQALGPGKILEGGSSLTSPSAPLVGGVYVTRGAKTTSTSSSSFRLEITEWKVEPCTPANAYATGGVASGRVRLRVPSEHVDVEGTFTNAKVEYQGMPAWAYR